MKPNQPKTILLTGATGYIGQRLLPALINDGHHVICCVRDAERFSPPSSFLKSITVLECDFLKPETLTTLPNEIDAAYFLMHAMAASHEYQQMEAQLAENFKSAMEQTQVQQVIYLSGIVNEDALSEHLASRLQVERILSAGNYHLTTLRAGIIIGSGSASFEIIRDLVEKLPVMITPKWLNTQCQPIGITDVILLLKKTLFYEKSYGGSFDIGGPDVLTYKEMLLGFAKIRGLKRSIFIVPVMTPRLSSYWLFFVTATSYKLAQALVDSMKVKVVCADQRLQDWLGNEPLSYDEALRKAFDRIKNNEIISSWKDAFASGRLNFSISDFIDVPTHGCLKDHRSHPIDSRAECLQRIWRVGGATGWYYATWLWQLRGFLDKLVGGVGLRRGRTHEDELIPGDAVDFWRVLFADKNEGRVLLFAEMKLPGEAWLEFRIKDNQLIQTATFRPKGLLGRMYWYSILPVHGFIFGGMIRRIAGK